MSVINGSLTKILDEEYRELSAKMRGIVEKTGLFGRDRLRAQVRAAGLGQGLEKAWRFEVYPRGNRETIRPAGLIYSKAQKLHDAYNTGGVIKTKNGARFLAIPTDNVPHKFSPRRRMTPVEVEAHFNRDLEFRPHTNGRPGGVLVLPGVVRGQNKKGYRKATKKRVAQGRQTEDVIMFNLVPQARLQKKLDIESVAQETETMLDNNLAGDLNA